MLFGQYAGLRHYLALLEGCLTRLMALQRMEDCPVWDEAVIIVNDPNIFPESRSIRWGWEISNGSDAVGIGQTPDVSMG